MKTYRDGFEKALSFLTSIGLALVTAHHGGKLPNHALALLKQALGKPISMRNLARARVEARRDGPGGIEDNPAARALRALATLQRAQPPPSDARGDTYEVVQERNVFAHSVTPSSEEVARWRGARA